MRQPSKSRRGSDQAVEQAGGESVYNVLGVCGFLLVTVLIVYGRTGQHEFLNCDDEQYIYGNAHVAGGLTWENVRWSMTSAASGNWHPLTWISHMLDVECYGIHPGSAPWKGPEAGGHHFTNVLLHAAGAIVLFLALRRMTAAYWCSAFVAAMFALHPLRVESVAWAAERKDVLSGLFWMLTLLAYGGYAQRPSMGRYLAVAAFFALGLASKSMLVTLPCVLLLLDFWPLRRWAPRGWSRATSEEGSPRFAARSLGWLVAEKLPLLAMSAGVCWIVAETQRNAGAMSLVEGMTTGVRIANAAFSGVAYLWMTVWPVDLAYFYPHPAALGDEAVARLIWQGVAAGVLLAAITLLALWNVRRRPYLAVGWFWYLGTLAPVIGLIQVGAQARADRYTYLPMIGVSIMLTWGAMELAGRSSRARGAIGVTAAALLTIWAVVAVNQVAYWKDNFTLYEHAIRATGNNYFAHNNLGIAYEDAGKSAEALAEFTEAVRIAPNYDSANDSLGMCYARRNEFEKAIGCLQNAIRINPLNAAHYCNLGVVYLGQGKLDEAAREFRRAIELEPDLINGHQGLSTVLYRQKKWAELIAEWQEMLRLHPNDIGTLNNAAWFLATFPDAEFRDGAESLKLAQRANELCNGSDPRILQTLSAAYAETRQFSLAVKTANKAIDLATQQKKAELAESIRAAISHYELGKSLGER